MLRIIDLFSYPKLQPINVRAITDSYQFCDDDYNTTENMLQDLEKIGFTFSYYLDAIPYNLRPIV